MRGDETIKTAVSLPLRLFEAADRAARRRGVPRSRVFVEALEQHLAEEESDITAQINASLAHPLIEEEAAEEAAVDDFLAEANRRLLSDWQWER